jgi:hypothetical protein
MKRDYYQAMWAIVLAGLIMSVNLSAADVNNKMYKELPNSSSLLKIELRLKKKTSIGQTCSTNSANGKYQSQRD